MRIYLSLLALAFTVTSMAVRPRNPLVNVLQSDSTMLVVQTVGDGDVSFMQTVDGYVVARNADGDYCYVLSIADGEYVLSSIVAHNPADRTAEEMDNVRDMLTGRSLMATVAVEAKNARKEQSRLEPELRGIGLHSTAPLTSVGSPKVPVILVQFADLKFLSADTDAEVNELYDKYCNGTNNGVNYTGAGSFGAVKDYFIAQSDSLFQPDFRIIGPITLPKGYAYYGEDGSYRKDVNINVFFSEAIRAAQELVDDWSVFDNDDNGSVDMAFFIYAGEGQNGCDDTNTIWPKEMPSGGSIDEVQYGAYACCNETYKGKLDGIGVMVHELSHALGLPDLYDYNYSAFGMDYWDVMDTGNYAYDAKCPCGYSAYEKDFMGWKPLVKLEAGVEQKGLTLIPLSEGGGGYKIVNQNNEDEYYILDNRQNTGWDLGVGCSTNKYGMFHGMLVSHVDYNVSQWTSNRLNSSASHQRFTLIPADGDLISSMLGLNPIYFASMGGDPYPGTKGVTSLEGDRAVVYAGGVMGQPITNIQEEEDGIITFDFCVTDTVSNAIESIGAEDMSVQIDGNTVVAVSPSEIYSIAGLLVARLERGESITLQRGVYVVRGTTPRKVLIP